MNNPFGSLITAMVTPFDENENINCGKAVELVNYLLDNGSDAVVLTGTTGESPVLTKDEKIELYKAVLESTPDKSRIIAGTGTNNTKASIELTMAAEKAGVGGIMLVTPYYNKPSQEGLYRHFKEIADNTSLPVILYNVPGRTGANLSVETTIHLSAIKNIISLKDATGTTDQAAAVLEGTRDGFDIYSGDDSLLLPFLSVGAKGVISVTSHLAGPRIKEIITLYQEGKNAEAAKLYRYLIPLFRGLFLTANPVPVKEALNLLGFAVGNTRLPLVAMSLEMRELLRQILSEYNIRGIQEQS